jgi:choline dehydrogenase-like flavoprotein
MRNDHTYDAIVVGSGITGGWAAKELTENSLNTLVLERGLDVKHVKDYPTTFKAPWDFEYRKFDTLKEKEEYHIQHHKYNFSASSKHFFVNDKDHPIIHPKEKPFRWFRGYQMGGRSLIWGRGAFRMGDLDFKANLKDGIGVDWPIRYNDIAPWYDYVEKFIGVCGTKENLTQFPDGWFLPRFELNRAEQVLKKRLESHYSDRKLVPNRAAHITKAAKDQFKGRPECQSRNVCHTGCPFGAYFSSNSSTLPAAHDTGRLTLKSHAIVKTVIYDKEENKAIGVQVIDANTKETTEYFARVIFLCASTLASTGLLLNSKTSEFSEGLANSSGTLGHYLMDHHKNISAQGELDGYEDRIYRGFKPISVMIPRYRNLNGEQQMDYLRGYATWAETSRHGIDFNKVGIGEEFKKSISLPSPWKVSMQSYGECLPYHDNKVELDKVRKDPWGLPLLKVSADFKENETLMRKDMKQQLGEMMEVAGLKNIKVKEGVNIQGNSTHEMGTARMGRDPKTSVLNGFNQCYDVPNLFVTDGSCNPSSGCLSPSLTYMALTARACNYAVTQLKEGKI